MARKGVVKKEWEEITERKIERCELRMGIEERLTTVTKGKMVENDGGVEE